MTVKELMNQLSRMPQDSQIYVDNEDCVAEIVKSQQITDLSSKNGFSVIIIHK